MLIGKPAIIRAAFGPSNKVNLLNVALAATEAVTITKARVYVQNTSDHLYFGIFFNTGGTNWKCRSATGDLGNVLAGFHEFDVTLPCQIDDCIGAYSDDTSSYFYYATAGGAGYWVVAGANHCVVDDEASWTLVAGREASIEGESAGIGPGVGAPMAMLMGLI